MTYSESITSPFDLCYRASAASARWGATAWLVTGGYTAGEESYFLNTTQIFSEDQWRDGEDQ